MINKSISVFIPALDEEENIKESVENVLWVLKKTVKDWEIIIIDDGSSDRTGEICRKLNQEDKRIKTIRHSKNQGLGKSFISAINQATKKYMTVFPGDNDMARKSLYELVIDKSHKDIIFSYPAGSSNRSFIRNLLSKTFVKLMNWLFNLNIKYYNGPFIVELKKLRELPLISKDYLIYAELKIRLIKNGVTYKETEFMHVGRKHGRSKAVSFRNLASLFKTVINLKRSLST